MTDWYELYLEPGARLFPLYLELEGRGDRVHHFWDEPWNPGAYVVRIRVNGNAPDFRDLPGVASSRRWDGLADDMRLYGDGWPWVAQLFEASSVLAAAGEQRRTTEKLIHCMLNARGMSVMDEARFAFRFGLRRVWVAVADRWLRW